MEKLCNECGDKFTGRADKRFCSDQCRVAFNNRTRSDSTNYVRNVNNILRKNRRILESLNPTGKVTLSRSRLNQKGFDFGYHTDTYKTRDGAFYKYCYEQGYLELDSKTVLLVKKEVKELS